MDNASAFSQVLRFLEEGLADLVSNIPAFRRGEITELRLRTGRPLSAVFGAESLFLSVRGELTEHAAGAYICTGAELQDTFYKLCRNSVYAYEQELKEGFVTIPGGHRCGFAGRTVVQDGAVTGLREISSINIRIARQVVGCADGILPYIYDRSGLRSGLIVSPPGGGKTTVLKDLIRSLSCAGRKVAVVDERGELASMFGGAAERPRPARGRAGRHAQKGGDSAGAALPVAGCDRVRRTGRRGGGGSGAAGHGRGRAGHLLPACAQRGGGGPPPSGGKAAGRGRGRRNRSAGGRPPPGHVAGSAARAADTWGKGRCEI